MSIKLLLALCLLSVSFTVSAQINKWVDEQGKTHYGTQTPAGLSAEKVKPAASGGVAVAVGSQSVVLYSTSWCGYCKQARAYMAREGIAYKEYDIEDSLSAKLDYDRAGGRGVPFLVRGDDILAGFNQQSYDRFFSE